MQDFWQLWINIETSHHIMIYMHYVTTKRVRSENLFSYQSYFLFFIKAGHPIPVNHRVNGFICLRNSAKPIFVIDIFDAVRITWYLPAQSKIELLIRLHLVSHYVHKILLTYALLIIYAIKYRDRFHAFSWCRDCVFYTCCRGVGWGRQSPSPNLSTNLYGSLWFVVVTT